MHGNFNKGQVNRSDNRATNPMAIDPVDVVMRLARDLKGHGVKVVVLGNIQLEFFEPKSMEPEPMLPIDWKPAAIEDLRDNAKNEPIDLDTYHLE